MEQDAFDDSFLLGELGHEVKDLGDLAPGVLPHASCDNPAVDQLEETLGWTKTLRSRVSEVLAGGHMPIVLILIASVVAARRTRRRSTQAPRHGPEKDVRARHQCPDA